MENEDRRLSISIGNKTKDIARLQSFCQEAGSNAKSLVVHASISDDQVEPFADALRANPSLTSITLDLPEISDSGFDHLSTLFNRSLRSLGIWANRLTSKGLEALAQNLLTCPRLERLDLYATQCDRHDLTFGDAGVDCLARALERQRKIMTYVGVRQNAISDVGVANLMTSLQRKTYVVETLNLQGNNITSVGVSHIARMLKESGDCLKELSLEGNSLIGDDGAILLADALSSPTARLESLNLKSCAISDAGAMRFAQVLSSSSSSLRELILDGNSSLGDKSVELIARALARNSTLTRLGLKSCRVGDEGTVQLARSLRENRCLEHLLLDNNEIGDAGAIELADALQRNRTLKYLSLTKTRIGGQGRAKLTRSLEFNSVMLEIALASEANASSTDLRAVEGLLAKNREIEKLRRELETCRRERDEALAQLAGK
ncbi:NLR family CARD domain-containing protein 3-like [Oscarella lobularis]|uniref:NLR family CARD domain-containing protein 3-like n=1 Tax=Oscarella lobularis TaxID=121494 RepID=UPI003313AF71